MSLNAVVRDDELHAQADAERASERVLRPLLQFARWKAGLATLTAGVSWRHLCGTAWNTFGLGTLFSAFFSSCYLGVRKPDPRIYQIALDVMQADPAASVSVA